MRGILLLRRIVVNLRIFSFPCNSNFSPSNNRCNAHFYAPTRSSIGETNRTLLVPAELVNLAISKKRESFCFFPPSASNRGNGFRKKLRLTPADRKDILQRKDRKKMTNPQNEEQFPASLNARPMSPIWISKPRDLPSPSATVFFNPISKKFSA